MPKFEKPKFTADQVKEIMEIVMRKEEEIPDDALGCKEIKDWLRTTNLEQYLEGKSFEQLIIQQEQFYQKFYGQDFKIDRNRLFIEKERLPLIKHGLEKGAVNYALITATPEKLSKQEQEQTEAEYMHHKLLKPLEKKGIKIWEETGTERWTELTLAEWLKRVLPVELNDFNLSNLEANWKKELARVIDKNKQAPKQQANKLRITFINNNQDLEKDQILINQDNQETTAEGKYSFIEMIKNKVKALTPEQWIILASQLYQKDKTYLTLQNWDWLMAIIDHRDKAPDPKVSAANAYSGSAGVRLYSNDAPLGNDLRRWRVAL